MTHTHIIDKAKKKNCNEKCFIYWNHTPQQLSTVNCQQERQPVLFFGDSSGGEDFRSCSYYHNCTRPMENK